MSNRSKEVSGMKKKKLSERKKGKKVQELEEDLESSEEELDLTKECHPIGHYVNDREEMINQMFSVIKGNKLKAMLPPVLKDCDVDQLKLQCLDQLIGMSEKRITAILEGEILESSSESEIESEEENSDEKSKSSDRSSSRSEEVKQGSPHNRERKHKEEKRKEVRNADKVTPEEPVPEQGKTLLEILELEMRARAIRALLSQSEENKAQANTPTSTATSTATGEEVVDLTASEDDFPKPPKPRTTEIDKKVSTFEEKIERAKEKQQKETGDKKEKLKAELDLRNKLFKKKIYRTRQQRMDNEEEGEKPPEGLVEENVVVKEEPKDEGEIVIEDPEEGEVSTSEDEGDVVRIKQEPEPEEADTEVEEESAPDDNEPEEGGEKITAIDNGTFISNQEIGPLPEPMEESTVEESAESQDVPEEVEEPVPVEQPCKESELECDMPSETSWKERWLQKGGVQKLVKSSKIFAKVKKRMKTVDRIGKLREEASEPITEDSDSNSTTPTGVIQGSVEEYNMLTKSVEEHTACPAPAEEPNVSTETVEGDEVVDEEPNVSTMAEGDEM